MQVISEHLSLPLIYGLSYVSLAKTSNLPSLCLKTEKTSNEITEHKFQETACNMATTIVNSIDITTYNTTGDDSNTCFDGARRVHMTTTESVITMYARYRTWGLGNVL